MADIDVLSAKLEVKDSFTSQLNKFVKAVDNSEKSFDKLMTQLEQSTSKMEQSIDKVSRKFDQFAQKVNSVNKSISNSIENSTKKVEQVQTTSIDNISKKYSKMGTDVQGVFKSINKNAEDLAKSGINIKLGGSSKKKDDDDDSTKSILGGVFAGEKTESFLGGILSGNFTRVLGTMSLIGAGITGVKKVLDTMDSWIQQGYNVLNTLSTGLFSVSGLEKNIEEASNLETSRVALDTLYGSKELGQQFYKTGITAAQNSTFGETDVIALQKKLAGVKLNYNSDSLQTILGLAALKPELGVEHVGFSLVRQN